MTHIEYLEKIFTEYEQYTNETEKEHFNNPNEETLVKASFWCGATYAIKFIIDDLKKGGGTV